MEIGNVHIYVVVLPEICIDIFYRVLCVVFVSFSLTYFLRKYKSFVMSVLDVFGLQLGSIRSFFWPQNSRLVVVVVVVVTVPTRETHWRFHLITWYATSGICEPGRRLFLLIPLIVDCPYGISLLRSLNFEVLQVYVISLQLDSFSDSVASKLCSSLKTFGKTCKNPAATWLDIWAPLLSWVSRSLTLFLFLNSWLLIIFWTTLIQ